MSVTLGAADGTDSLVARCVAGDGRAWRELHRTHLPVAGAFLRKLGVRDEDLEDACQEVFVEVHRYLRGFEGRAAFKTWLYKLCVTQARRVRRRYHLVKTIGWLLGRSGPEPGAQTAAPGAGDAEARHQVQAALEKMTDDHRLVFVLYELEGLSGDDIARITGCPWGTVRSRLHYARKQFEGLMAAPGMVKNE